MNAHEVVQVLHRAGLSLSVTPERGLKVAPASKLTPPLRELVQASKPALIDLLTRLPEPANDATSPTTPASPIPPAPAPPDPDRWCWPHSEAMNTAELQTLLHHIGHFTRRGLSFAAAERLADQLVQAQRTADTRRTCLQCQHLSGHGAGAWHCRNGQRAGLSVNGRVAYLPTDWVTALQRCDGFVL